jgi:hypothetical protein
VGHVYRHGFFLKNNSIGRQMLQLIYERNLNQTFLFDQPLTSYLMSAVAVSSLLPHVCAVLIPFSFIAH